MCDLLTLVCPLVLLECNLVIRLLYVRQSGSTRSYVSWLFFRPSLRSSLTVARLLRWHGSPLLQPLDRTQTEISSEPFLESYQVEKMIDGCKLFIQNFSFNLLTCSLVSDMLQCGGNVDLLGALHHPVKDHVDEDIGPRPSHPVTAVNDHRA